jgi:hypothetical protein
LARIKSWLSRGKNFITRCCWEIPVSRRWTRGGWRVGAEARFRAPRRRRTTSAGRDDGTDGGRSGLRFKDLRGGSFGGYGCGSSAKSVGLSDREPRHKSFSDFPQTVVQSRSSRLRFVLPCRLTKPTTTRSARVPDAGNHALTIVHGRRMFRAVVSRHTEIIKVFPSKGSGGSTANSSAVHRACPKGRDSNTTITPLIKISTIPSFPFFHHYRPLNILHPLTFPHPYPHQNTQSLLKTTSSSYRFFSPTSLYLYN